MAIIKHWALGELGAGPITLNGVTYTQGLDEDGEPGIEAYVPTDFVDWETDNRPLMNLVENDEKLNEHIEINSRQMGNGIFEDLGDRFLVSIVDNKLTREEVYDLFLFVEDRDKIINLQLPKGLRYLWIDIEDDLVGTPGTIVGSETTTDTARWYWKQWVDGVITEDTFLEVDTSTVITNSGDRELVKEVLNNRAQLEDMTPLHLASGVAFINGNYSTIAQSKPVYDEDSYQDIGGTRYYNTDSGEDTLIKDIETEIEQRYPDVVPATWEVTLVVTEVDATGSFPHNEYTFNITIGPDTFTYTGQFPSLIVANFIWDRGGTVDALYDKLFEIGEILIPYPPQQYDVDYENTPFREYDPRYKIITSGHGYPQSADPDIVIRHGGAILRSQDRGILPVSNVQIFRDFEVKEAAIDTSGGGSSVTTNIPIQDEGLQLYLSYEFTDHIIAGEGRWDDFFNTWIEGFEPDPLAVKNVEAIAEFDGAIYFAYHHKLYRLVQNTSQTSGDSLDNIDSSVSEGAFTFGLISDPSNNVVAGNDDDDFTASDFITALVAYDGWLYIGTSNGYVFRFQEGTTGAQNTIEQVVAAGAPVDLITINTFYVWEATDQLAIGTNAGFRLLEHDLGGNPANVTIQDLGTESPAISNQQVTTFTEISKYGSGFTQVLVIGTNNVGIYYYGDQAFNSGLQFHHDDNYTNFVLDGDGEPQDRRDQFDNPIDFADNQVTIKKFIKHKTQQDAQIYMLVGIDDASTAWDDDFGHHEPGDEEVWRLIDGNNEGDHEHFSYQRLFLYENNPWGVDNFLTNASFEIGDSGDTPDDWDVTSPSGSANFQKTDNNPRFGAYRASMHNVAANTINASQTYAPDGGLGIVTSKTFTFSAYLLNENASAVSVEIGVEGLDQLGNTVLDSASSTINITQQNAWSRETVTATFTDSNIYQIRVYIEMTAAGDVGVDAVKLEESSSATLFNSGGITTANFTSDGHACDLQDMVSFNDHIVIGGIRDVRGEFGEVYDEDGYSYPTGAPADIEYPARPDGGLNSDVDVVDGSATNTLDNDVIEYLASNEGLYYMDQLILHNTTFGLDFYTLFKDSNGTLWAGGRARLFRLHAEEKADTSDLVTIIEDENMPIQFRQIVRVPADDNPIDLIDGPTPQWHSFVDSSLLVEDEKDRRRLIKGSVIVRNNPTGRVTYSEGRDYEVEYDPTSDDYGKIRRKPNPLFEGNGQGRIEPDQRVYIEYKHFEILEEVTGSSVGFKDLSYENREVTINLPGSVTASNYELYCDYVYTRQFEGVENTIPDFNTPGTGAKDNLKPYDYVLNPAGAQIWPEKFHLIAYSKNQRLHPLYAEYDFSIPRVDIIQVNYSPDSFGFITTITPGIPHENAPIEPNPSEFDENFFDSVVAGSGGSITYQHVWHGFVNTDDALRMFTMNVTQSDFNLNDIYDRRYYITKLQLKDYFIGIKTETEAYFPYSRSFVSSDGRFVPQPKVAGDSTTAVQNSIIEFIDDNNEVEFGTFPGEFDEQGYYDAEDEFEVYWDYTPDYFGLPTIDEFGVRQFQAVGGTPPDPGVPRGLYIIDPRSSGVGFDNQHALRINRNLTVSQDFTDAEGNFLLGKDIWQFDLEYYLENAYNATSSSVLELRLVYEDDTGTEQYYSTSRPFTGSSNDLEEDRLDTISVRADAAIIPKRIEIRTSGWDESDEYGGGDTRYVGGTIFQDGDYVAKLNLYVSNPRMYITGIDTTKFYRSAARFNERVKYDVPLSGYEGSIYFKFKPLFPYDYNYTDNSSKVIFDSRQTQDQENYFQIIFDNRNYQTVDPLDEDDFNNKGTLADPYPKWGQQGGEHRNSFKVVFYARQLNIQPSSIEYKYRSYSLDTNDPNLNNRVFYNNNQDLQQFHTLIVTWERLDEIYPHPNIFSDGFNNYQFLMRLYFDDNPPIQKLIIVDPRYLESLTEGIQVGGGWLKTSYNPSTQNISWYESTAEGFFSDLRIEKENITHDKARLWIEKALPFLDADQVPIVENIYTLGDEIKILSGTDGQLRDLRAEDVFVEGDLYVLGNEVVSNISKMVIEDNIVEVNRIQEIDEDGNWIGIPEISSPVRSGLKSYRHPDEETYDSSFIWDEDADEWQLIELSKFDITYGDNVLAGAAWQVTSGGTGGTGTGIENAIYSIVTKSDNTPTPLYQNSEGTFTFRAQLKSLTGGTFQVQVHTVAQLQNLSEIEHFSDPITVTTTFTEHLFRVVYETDEITQITIYIEVITAGIPAIQIDHQNEFFAKTEIDLTNYELPNETQDLRLRKVIIAAPIANPGEEAFITFENSVSAIKIEAVDGLYINNAVLADSMVFKGEQDGDSQIELQLYDSGGSLGHLRLGAVRPDYIENITNNEVITTFSGRVSSVQESNLQISKSGHIEPGPDATDVYVSSNNDQYELLRVDQDANIYFRKAVLRDVDEANSSSPLIANEIDSKLLDLNDGTGTQNCVRITKDQSGTGSIELAPIVCSEIALGEENESNGIKYLQTYELTFIGRVGGSPGHQTATINHNLNIPLSRTMVSFGVNSPLRHVYWDTEESNANTLVVRLDDENTMTTTNDPDPANWVDPNDGKIVVHCTIMEQVPVTTNITMS